MNDNDRIVRIVTTTGTPQRVGPRVTQWAYGRQPHRDIGLHVQVRSERGAIALEAVWEDTGELEATASTIVDLCDALRGGRFGLSIRIRGLASRKAA